MDSERAKIILSVHRFDEPDKANSELREARELVQNDPELRQWFTDQKIMDDKMRNALKGMRPPAHLKAAILASARKSNQEIKRPVLPRRHTVAWGMLALAACIFFMIGANIYFSNLPAKIPVSALTARVEKLQGQLPGALGKIDPDVKSLRVWLADHKGLNDFSLPNAVADKASVGCQVLSVQGNKVSLVCFQFDDKRIVHYLVVDKKNLRNPPPVGKPLLLQENGTSFAMWSDQNRTYILAEFSDTNKLGELL